MIQSDFQCKPRCFVSIITAELEADGEETAGAGNWRDTDTCDSASVCLRVWVYSTSAALMVSSVINTARTASSRSHTDTVQSLMRPGEAWNDEMKSSLYQHVMAGILNVSAHLHNCFRLLQMLRVQWMVMDDNDNGYMIMMMMMPFIVLETLQQLKRERVKQELQYRQESLSLISVYPHFPVNISKHFSKSSVKLAPFPSHCHWKRMKCAFLSLP